MEISYIVRLNGKGAGSIEYLQPCEARECQNPQGNAKASNYGLCDEHYKSTDFDCERCGAQAFHWCAHK